MRKDLDGVIAIVGLSGRFPGARNVEELWRSVRDGVDLVRFFTDEELRALGVSPALLADPTYVKAAAQPPDLDKFDAGFFGINHREAEILDPQQRVFLETCWEALEDAGYDPDALGNTVTGVFGGQTTSTYLLFNLLPSVAAAGGTMDPLQLLVGNAGDSLATRVSYKLNLKGPSYTVQSACSTSAVAVHTACQSLLNGECDLALAGGVSINVHLLTGYRATEGSVFAKSGKCRAFDAGAEGILFGGGAGVVVLKRAEDALKDRDNIHALILGSAVNNDGALKVGYTAPSVDGQAEVIAEAWAAAGAEMESASYIEAHGTGTRLGDPIEIQALTKAFRPPTGKLEKKQFIPIGSVKTNIGHLDVAAGIAGLIKTVMALKHRQIPPSLHFQEPNSEIDFAGSPVFVNTELRPWEGAERRAGVSSFGFGGTNVHLVLEEAPELPATRSERERFFLPLSARSEPALEQACQRLADWLEDHPELDLADVEHTLRVGRRTFEQRRVVECRTRQEAIEALREGKGRPSLGEGEWGGGRGDGGEGRRVSLPTYPFERRRYWIDAPGVAVADVAICSVPARQETSFHPRPSLFTPFEPHRDEHEEKVCLIWEEVLGVQPVGVHDDFFQLGGHSLLATQILSRVRALFGVDFPLQHLFSFPTSAELAEAIRYLQEESGEETPRIGRSPLRETGGPFPLSFSQQRLWIVDQLDPGTPLYNELRSVLIQGPVLVPVLERSLQELVHRHEALRTTFHLVGEAPVQVIEPRIALPLAVADLSVLPGAAREREVLRLAVEEAQSSFDLVRGPLVRTRLLKLEDAEHLLLLDVHHIASDGWSMGIVVRETVALYDAFSRGLPSPLPELPIQYADFAHWQREWLQGEILEGQLAYWREALAGAPSVLELPTDRPRPSVQSPLGGSEPLAIPPEVTAAVGALAQREGATLFMVLLAALQALLHRLSGQDDLLVGSPIANRNRPEIEGLIGFFVNTLVLRGRTAPDLTFRGLLAQASAASLGAFAHQDLPFERLAEELRIESSTSHSPLFQVMLALHNVPSGSLDLPGLTVTPKDIHAGLTRFELILGLTEMEGGLAGGLEYRSQLFDAATAHRLAERFTVLLAGAAADPDLRLADLPLLPEGERHQLLVEWNDAAASYPDVCLHELVAAQVERTPDAAAVVFEEEALTYRELWARALTLAGFLRSLGVGPEVRVGVCAERSTELVVGLLGVLVAGGAYVPIDPDYPLDRVAFMLEDSAVPVLLTQAHLAGRLPAHRARVVLLGETRDGEDCFHVPPGDPDTAAYAIYTSGSTGRPKGAVNSHRGIVNRLLWMQEKYGLTPDDRVLQKTPFSFDVSVWEFFWPLITGARMVVARPGGHQDGDYLARTIAGQGITTIHFVPSMLRVFLEEPGLERCASLRRVICSGEALPLALQQRFHQTLTSPDTELHNLYGPTEAAVDVTWWACERGAAATIVPIGRPVANTRIHVLDRALRPAPLGVPRELCIGGIQVARGYLGRPELTADRFVPDPFAEPGEEGARLYRTGDLARHLPNGAVEYLGRLDHQIKLRGLRIELGEIEAAIGEHPAVSDCAVLARDEASGEKRLVAYVVAPSGGSLEEELRASLAARLPEYMVPSAFVFLGEMPLSPNGKADRKALARIAPEPVAASTDAGAAPRNRREELLASIWAGVLGLEHVGVHDNFFKLGGDSILSIQIAARARRAGLVVVPKQVFERPTIAELAEVAEAALVEIEQGPVVGPVPLTPVQRFFFDHEPIDPHHFNQSIFLDARGPLLGGPLAAALDSLLEHHDALRLRFTRRFTGEEGGWTQRHEAPGEPAALVRIDLAALPAERRREAMLAAAAGLQTGLDLARGPLLRAAWFSSWRGEGDRLQLVIHHLAVDGISWQILLEDLNASYSRLAAGEEIRLPLKTVSWKRWAELLAGHALSGALRDELPYWLSQIRDAREVSSLPVDLRGRNDVGRSAVVSLELAEEETDALLQAASASHAQVQDLLLAALARTLADWTGRRSVWLDLEGHGREEIVEGIDVSHTVGWFTTVYPIALDLPENGLGALVRIVKETLRSVPNRGIGYGLLRWMSGDPEVAAALAALPRREVLFNYLGRLGFPRPDECLLAPASEFPPGARSPRDRRWYPLEVDALILSGRLRVDWMYGAEVHRAETIQALADGFTKALRDLLQLATAPAAYSRSDFPLARLDQAALDGLLAGEREVEDLYPLAPVQQGMLFHSLAVAGVGTDPYIVQISCSLNGPLDVDAFRRSWQEVVDHHPALRTAFLWRGLEEPLQLVRSKVGLPWTREDWRGRPEAERSRRLRNFLERDKQQAFDLERAPLMRMALLRTGEEEHQFVWTSHHLLLDGWCLPILFQDFASLYEARLEGRSALLPLRRPYADFLAWLERQDPAASESFWREAMSGLTGPTPLPFDHPWVPGHADDDWSQELFLLPAGPTAALERLAHYLGVTLSTLVQGAWALLLSRTSGETDVTFGVVLAGRPSDLEGAESMVGMFVNSLPLRVRVDPEAELGAWMVEVQQRVLEVRQHEWTPLVSVQTWSGLPPGQPVFHSLLAFQNYPVERSLDDRLGGLSLGEFVFNQRTHYPITLAALPGEELALRVSYDRRFEPETVGQLLRGAVALLEGMARDPRRRLADLPLTVEPQPVELSDGERLQLAEWEGVEPEGPAPGPVHRLFEEQAASTPEAVAVEHGGRSLTYAELDHRAGRIASALRALGTGTDFRVGLLVERTLDLVAAILGIWKAGGAYVPLDPSLPSARLAFLVEDAGLRALVTQSSLEERLADLPLDESPVVLLDRLEEEAPALPETDAPDWQSRLAYVVYTSGTTGLPKGVLVEHGSLAHTLRAVREAFAFSGGDRMPCLAPFSFDIFLFELLGPLLSGGTSVLVDNRPTLDVPALAGSLGGMTLLHAVPALMRQIVEQVRERKGCGSLRRVFVGGDAVPPDLLAALREAFPAARVTVLYGPTEGTIVASRYEADGSGPEDRSSLLGRPVSGTRMRVADGEGALVPIGVPGELWIGGPGIARGYLNRGELTAQRFVERDGRRWYLTGDQVRWLAEGNLEFLGRIDQQVKIRGFRIELGEIEATLTGHPSVRQAVVLAVGAGEEKRLAAYVVPASGREELAVLREDLRRLVSERLPEYMAPSAWFFPEELLLTAHGKVDRKALASLPVEEEARAAKAGPRPRTPTEQALAGLWAEILGRKEISARDDFFDLGGHSLLVTRLASRVWKTFGVELPLQTVFEASMLEDLAARIDEIHTRAAVQDKPSISATGARSGPLSYAQERLWFLYGLDPLSAAYNVPAALRLTGPLDPAALEQGLAEVVRRHGSLRTVFSEESGEPVQTLVPEVSFRLPVEDVRRLSPDEREIEVERILREDVDTPFDLRLGPVIRARLLRLEDEEWLLLLNLHHIVSDGWSMGVLVGEGVALYEAFSQGRPSPLPELPIQYLDFAVWQREWLQGEVLDEQIRYWKQALAGAPALLDLPTDRPRPAVQTWSGASEPAALPSALVADLDRLGRREGATLFMTLLGAFQAVLHRYAGQEDVVVGSPVANRRRSELEGLIGFFVNTLVLRGRISESLTFRRLLSDVRATALGAFAHQDLPFGRLVEELAVERNQAHSPLFQVMFVLQNAPAVPVELPGLTTRFEDMPVTTSKFDLTLTFFETGGGLSGSLDYATGLFDPATIRRLLGHLQTLLESAVADPDARLADLPLLTAAEREQIAAWNATAVEYPEATLTGLIEAQVETAPGAPAIVFEGETLTYRQLDERATALARHLASIGAGPETLVGICAERSLEMVVGLLAILKAGGAYVPLDPAYPSDRLAFMLEDSAVPVLLTQNHLVERLPAHGAKTVLLDPAGGLGAGAESALPQPVTANFAAYAIFTSGSTGRPKGAVNSHRGIVNRLLWMQSEYGLTPEDRVLQKTPFSFDVSVWEFFWPLITGARLVVARPGGHQDPGYLVDLIVREGITTLHFVPSMLQVFVEQPGVERCASLRRVMASGEALPAELAKRFFSRLPEGVELHNLYGPTEAAVDVTFHACQPGEESVPIGRPVANTCIHLLDREGKPVPVGVAGELHIGGVQVARGYLRRPALTAELFVPDPFAGPGEAGARLYRTGDLARYLSAGAADTAGAIEYLGRIDHQVKIRGFRIELGEIEAALARQPEVREAVVLARGEGGERSLAAYVIVSPPAKGRESDLRARLREALRADLPEHMVPADFTFLDAMPVTPNGKADRKALARMSPGGPGADAGVGAEGPEAGSVGSRTPVEDRIAAIWREILKIDRVGVRDSFFELGGHSLLGMRLIARLRNVYGVELPLQVLFEAPTVEGIAARVEAARLGKATDLPPIKPVPRDADLPLSFPQERLWFLDQLEPDSPLYNISIALRMEGDLRLDALEWALVEVARRHEALRTTFPDVAGRPVQRIAPEPEVHMEIEDLSGTAGLPRRLEELSSRPFDLARGPLFRSTLLRVGQSEWVLLVTVHHIVSDGWSLGVLIEEGTALYRAFVDGLPSPLSPLAPLPVQYADFAVWQRGWMSGEVLDRQLAWWREELAGAPTLLELPTDRPRPSVQTFHGAVSLFTLPPRLAALLADLSRREGATLFMVLLAAFQALLQRYSGQDDLLVGSPVAGRTSTELEGLIGFFVNTVVLRGRMAELPGDEAAADGPRFIEMLDRVRTSTLGAFAHQAVPFERLIEELGVERSLAHNPLVQVTFALQNAPRESPALPGLSLSVVDFGRSTSKFDLGLGLVEQPDGILSGVVEYSTDLFDEATIRRLCGHFETLLAGIAAGSVRRLGELPLLTAAEARQAVAGWNATRTNFPSEVCVHELFEEQAARTPDAVAAVFGDEVCTYRDLQARGNRLAWHLLGLGVRPGDRVGIYLERSLDMVVSTLAVLKAGGAYVPLDTSYPEERLAFMLEDAAAPVLITRERWLGLFSESPTGAGFLSVCLDRDRDLLERQSDGTPPAGSAPEGLAYVIYTSGSTGKPKGVAVPHRAIVRLVRDTNYAAIRPDDVIAQASNTSFDAATFEIWGALLNGARMVGVTKETMLSPRDLSEQIRRDGITILFLTTALFNQVVREEADAFQPLRSLLFGGEASDPALVRRLLRDGGPERLLHVYGPTESTTYASWHLVREVPEGAATVPIGQPLSNTTLLVLDRGLKPVPAGVTGELYIGGEGLAWGYLNRPELTAERFVPDPFSPAGDRLYKTGDLVRRQPLDGAVEFLGRADFQVKVRGFRIELGEVEAALVAHPDVRDAVVLVLGDGSDKRLVAYVAGTPSSDLREHLSDRLPSFMIPSGWVFLESLPLNPNGKVDRRALASIQPEIEETGTSVYMAPGTPVEEMLAGAWMELLGVPRVGVHDDFFSLGGHSLMATRLVSRLRDLFEVDLSLRTVFEAPELGELARRIEEARGLTLGLQPPPIVPVSTGERGPRPPLSFAQERLWFLERLEPGTAFYSVPAALRIAGRLEIPALGAALGEIVRRHEALRTTFDQVDGIPFQAIAPPWDVPVPVVDLTALPVDLREAEADRQVREESRRPFDLGRGPLLRALLLRLEDEDWRAFFNLHHIVSDGWSIGVLVRELGALYEAAAEGRPSPLPELPVQYADFALWQRAWLGEVLEGHIAYWRDQLGGARTVLDLPSDRPRPPVQTFRGSSLPVALPARLSSGVAELGHRHGATLFMTLLSAYQALLFRYTRQGDILVGSPVAGRGRREIEGMIGLFVNTVVLRGRMELPDGTEPTFGELLERTRSMALGAFAHQDLPFERLVDELRVERSMARHPVFQTVFALQNAPAEALSLPGLTLEGIALDSGTSKLDLLLSLSEAPGAAEGERVLSGVWEYSTDLFDATTIERMTGHLGTLLAGAVADPGRTLSSLPLLTEAERHQAVAEWNATAEAFQSLTFHDLFAATAARVPDNVAVVFRDQRGKQQLTYAALAARAERLAARLRSLGIGPEVLVGICADEGIERVIAVLGVFRAGGAYLPLDPSHPKERIAWMMQDAQVHILLTQESLFAALPDTEAEIVTLDGLLDEGREEIPAAPPAPHAETLPDNLAYVIYTSGSTGRPNGVLVRHRSAVHLIGQAVRQFQVDERSRVLQSVSFSFDASVLETWMAFAAGATLCVSRREVRMSGTALAEMIRHDGITQAVLTPSVLGGLPREAFPTLRTISVGGDSCPAELVTRWSPPQRASRLLNCYGPTETTIYAVAKECRGTFRKEPPIGRPLGNIRAYVVDPTGCPVPVGVPGELWLGGEGVARGYLNRPGLTAERFLPDPFAISVEDGGGRLYRTGDLVRILADGDIEFLGRVDRQVKVRGLRMELGEIEAALGRHPLVAECAVLALGQGSDKRLVGFVVARPDGDVTAIMERGTRDLITQLREPLRQTLPEYMVPASFLFLETMPLTPVGKVDRRVLSQMDLAFDWEVERVEARDVLELELARLWSDVLGIARIGVRDNFFELGGHSLLAVRLVEQVQQRFGRDLPLAVLFQGGTVEEMAALLRDDSVQSSCLVPIHPVGKAMPFFCVHPAGGDVLCFASLARSLGPNQPFYGLQSRGMAGDGEPLTRIEEMAALYLEEVRTVQPSGPYLLGGWSLGALIAFEMARQLRSAGEEVALLAVLDSAPDIPGAGIEVEEDHVTALLEIAQYVERLWGKDVKLVREDLEDQDPEAGLELLLERLRAADFLPPGAGVGQLRRILKVYQANTLAARRYVPERYSDRVTLFRAADVPKGVGPRPSDLGWGRLSGQPGEPVEVHVIPGDHITMLAEPNVHELARRLRTALEGACEPAEVV